MKFIKLIKQVKKLDKKLKSEKSVFLVVCLSDYIQSSRPLTLDHQKSKSLCHRVQANTCANFGREEFPSCCIHKTKNHVYCCPAEGDRWTDEHVIWFWLSLAQRLSKKGLTGPSFKRLNQVGPQKL